MSEPTTIEPLRISFDVACSAEHAFNTWANKTSLWWPDALTTEGIPGFTVTYEPRIGGRIFEKAPSGKETEWGEITAWDPPKRLAYAFHIMTTRERATDVEIEFIPAESRKTRVEITHTGWERLGADGQDWRNQNYSGWSGVLPHFIEACAANGE